VIGGKYKLKPTEKGPFYVSTAPPKQRYKKSPCASRKTWCIKGFFCPNNWQTLTRRNGRGINAFMGEKQIPRLLICNVWASCVLSLFLMVWHLPITKNKQGNNENTLDIPRNICYNMLNGRFPIRKKETGLIGSHIAQ
jgi:hypothetical protein